MIQQAMQTEPLAIPGLSGAVTVHVNEWTGKRRLFVGGTEVPTQRGKFELAGPDGRLTQGRIKPLKFWQTYPKVEFGGVTHSTGPDTPTGLTVVACLPVLLFAGAALGVLLGFAAILINFAVIRSGASKVAVVATSIGTLLAGALIYLVVAGLISGALGG